MCPNQQFPQAIADLLHGTNHYMFVTTLPVVDLVAAAYFASGSGRSWNLITCGRFSLPPSLWNTVRSDDVAHSASPLPAGIRIVDAPLHPLGEESHRVRHAQGDELAVHQRG